VPDLVNVSGDPLLARILAARCGVSSVGVADLGLGEGDQKRWAKEMMREAV
jgi:hypothetical protein